MNDYRSNWPYAKADQCGVNKLPGGISLRRAIQTIVCEINCWNRSVETNWFPFHILELASTVTAYGIVWKGSINTDSHACFNGSTNYRHRNSFRDTLEDIFLSDVISKWENYMHDVLSWAKETTLFFVDEAGWQLLFSRRGDRYACVTLRYAVSDRSRLSSLPLLENKSRAANRNSASLKKGCRFFCSW